MKIKLSESGHTEEFKPLEELPRNIGTIESSPYGGNYLFLGFESKSKIAEILKKSDKEIKVYFFENIIYINIDTEPVFYTVCFFKEDKWETEIRKQILKDKKLLINITKDDLELENMFGYDIII